MILHKSVNESDLLFEKILNEIYWFSKSKIVASFFSIKSEISTTSLNKFIFNKTESINEYIQKDNSSFFHSRYVWT